MTNTSFSNILSQASQTEAKSPWNAFLNTLDTKSLSDREAMDLFAKTLASSRSDWKDSNDNTLLMHMASRGKTNIVKRLIHELYANVNATNKDGLTALHMAARNGQKEVCTELLDSHADVMKKTKEGATASMVADEDGHDRVATILKRSETAKGIFLSGYGQYR